MASKPQTITAKIPFWSSSANNSLHVRTWRLQSQVLSWRKEEQKQEEGQEGSTVCVLSDIRKAEPRGRLHCVFDVRCKEG